MQQKIFKILMPLYIFVIMISYLYCKPSMKSVIEMLYSTISLTSFNYLIMLVETFMIKRGKNKYFMEITGGLFKYAPFIITVGFILLAGQSTIELIKSKNFILACTYLPIIGSIHANSIILKAYSNNDS